MARTGDLYSDVAASLSEWLDKTPEKLVERWTGGGPKPFERKVSENEKRAYFRQLAFLPDGQPNVGGRQRLLDTYGVKNYTQIMRTLLKEQRDGQLEATRATEGDTLPDVEADTPDTGQEAY
jgi:hypothetical protein